MSFIFIFIFKFLCLFPRDRAIAGWETCLSPSEFSHSVVEEKFYGPVLYVLTVNSRTSRPENNGSHTYHIRLEQCNNEWLESARAH